MRPSTRMTTSYWLKALTQAMSEAEAGKAKGRRGAKAPRHSPTERLSPERSCQHLAPFMPPSIQSTLFTPSGGITHSAL
jgi:hypothetical protein